MGECTRVIQSGPLILPTQSDESMNCGETARVLCNIDTDGRHAVVGGIKNRPIHQRESDSIQTLTQLFSA